LIYAVSVREKKLWTLVCLIDYKGRRKQAVKLGHYEIGQLVRYSVKPTSTHRFKQEEKFLPSCKLAPITHFCFKALKPNKDILNCHQVRIHWSLSYLDLRFVLFFTEGLIVRVKVVFVVRIFAHFISMEI